MPKVKVTIGSEVKLCLNLYCSYTTEANLIQLHRKMKHNEKVCHTHDFGSYTHSQSCNEVRGQNRVSAITQRLLKQIKRNFTGRYKIMRRCVLLKI